MKKTKMEKLLITTSLISLSFLPFITNNKDQIYLAFKQIINNKDQNIYPTAKAGTLYEVQTLRKVTSDKNAINIIFLGDNYAKDADKNLFGDFCYTNIVKPWLSTVYPKNSEELANQTQLTCGTKVPFQTYLNDKINIYSVQPNFKYNSNIRDSFDNFFGIYIPPNSTSNIFSMSTPGKIKTNILNYDISKNFLEDGGIASSKATGLIRNGGGGRAVASHSYLSTTKDAANVHIHEMGHSIWRLADEYDETGRILGVNRALLTDTSEENIPWKEFLNFRGIGLVSTAPKNPDRYKEYIPSKLCLMKVVVNLNVDFCEVCTHQIIKRGVQITQNEHFYIADPQLTPSENRPSYNDQIYGTQYLESLELYNFNVDTANGKHLDFRTVVDNMTNKPKNVKLKITIGGDNGFIEESESFNINPGEIKQLKLITTKQANNLINNKNTIIGEVIDVDTNEVLATSYDRYNKFNISQDWITSQNFNFGKQLHTITINFLDKATNKPLPNIKPSILIKRNRESFQLQKILFNGYRLDESMSKINNQNININGQNLTFNYYYDALPFKSLKLKLIDQNNVVKKEKIVKVYEGQKFIPSSSDFFLYDLESFVGNSTENKNWVQSINAPETTYLYEQIQDNQTELIYTVSSEKPTYLIAKDAKIIQGENISHLFYEEAFNYFVKNVYQYDFDIPSFNDPNIIYNTVDTSKPGDYFVVLYYENNVSAKNAKHSLFKIKVTVKPNQNPSYTPNALEAEKIRLQDYGYVWIDKLEDKKGNMDDFESINQNNLLSNINNFNLNKEKFDYEVVDFQKLYPSGSEVIFLTYKFKIKITDKVSRTSAVTHEFNKYIALKDDETITPPTNEVELQNEINRINSLNLTLKNSTLTQEEVNNINQSNILQNINGWVETTGFLYEVINFSNNNLNNQFKFQIKVSKDNSSKISKEFILSYQIQNPGQTEEELIQQEINRINNLTLTLANNTFTQDEIDQITTSNFIGKLSNWSSVILNSNKYNYAIATLNKENNKFSFTIKVTLKSDSSVSKTSNNFDLPYQISPNVNQDLLNEKNRIDNLDLSLNKPEFTKSEIEEILKNPNSITKYLNNWSPQNQFNYEFIINDLSNNNQLSLTIKINQSNDNTEYKTSKEFILSYQISQNNNSSNSNNSTTIILASTLVPAGAIGAGAVGTIIYKKKKRKY